MQDEEQKDLLEELQRKLDLLEERIDELEDQPETGEDSEPTEKDVEELHLDLPFRVHWIDGYYGCDEIDSVAKAQTLFIQKIAEWMGDDTHLPVLNGDLIVFLCNHSTTSKIDPNSQAANAPHKYDDACYYVGMYVDDKDPGQTFHEDSTYPQLGGGIEGHKVFVWDTCGIGGAGEVHIDGHTGDVIESVLGTPTHTANCSGDQTILNLTFPVTEKTLTFEDGLLKSVSSPTQGTPITSTIYLPCCCDDDPSCASSVTLQISSIDGLSPSTSPIVAVPVPAGNYTSPNCAVNYGVFYDETDLVNAPFDIKTFDYSIVVKQVANTATYPSGYVTAVSVGYVNISDQYTLVFQKEYIPAAGEGANDTGNPTLGQYPPPVISTKNGITYSGPTTLTLS